MLEFSEFTNDFEDAYYAKEVAATEMINDFAPNIVRPL
jgi:hypothetical protein